MRGLPLPSMASIEESADLFRREYADGVVGALDIERIIDVKMGITIQPVPELCFGARSKGYASHHGRIICIDEHIFECQPEECRQTLAHEAAHIFFQRDEFPVGRFLSANDCRAFHKSLSTARVAVLEHAAGRWAQRVLMPRFELAQTVATTTLEVGEMFSSLEPIDDVERHELLSAVRATAVQLTASWFGVTESWATAQICRDRLLGRAQLEKALPDVKAGRRRRRSVVSAGGAASA
jgi:hypothetical protein